MLFEKIFDGIQKLGKPRDGDLVLTQIENDQWVAVSIPMRAQILSGDDYDDIETKALEYALDWMDRGRFITVWRQGDANKDEYYKVL